MRKWLWLWWLSCGTIMGYWFSRVILIFLCKWFCMYLFHLFLCETFRGQQSTNISLSQYITSLKANPAGNTIITGYLPFLLHGILCNCSCSKDFIVIVPSNMQVLVMGLLAYLTSVLVLQLTICQWELVVRYCFSIDVGIKGCSFNWYCYVILCVDSHLSIRLACTFW